MIRDRETGVKMADNLRWANRFLAKMDLEVVRPSASDQQEARLALRAPELAESQSPSPGKGAVAETFNYDLNLILIGNALAKILKAHASKPEIHWALVGNDPDLAAKAYHLLDFGLRPIGFYEGASDFMFEDQGLDALSGDGVDLLVVSDVDPAREAQLLERIEERAETRNGSWKIIRLRRIVDSHCQVMNQLVPSHFSTCLTPTKIAALTCAVALAPRSGVAVEAGVFLGGSTIYIAKLQRALGIKRRIFAFDTFAGIPAPTERDGNTPFAEGLFSQGTIETVHANYQAHGVRDDIQTAAGLVQDTLVASLSPSMDIGFALLDLDQYAGTRAGLDAVIPRLHPRGIIAVDDADGEGPSAAINESLEAHPEFMRCNVSTGFDLVLRRDAIGILSEG